MTPPPATPIALRPAARVGASEPTTVLRCGDTADLLAALPFLTGFTATNSLFVVRFSGARSTGVVRLDLPPAGDRSAARALLDGVCRVLRTTGGGSDGPAVVISCEQSFAESSGTPWRWFARLVEHRFSREGWPLRELAVVARDGWATLLHGADPAVGRPLSEIAASPLRALAAGAGASTVPIDELGRLPEAEPERRTAVLEQLAELDRRARADRPDHGVPGAPVWVRGIARVAGACFSGDGLPDPRLTARLIFGAGQEDRWFVLALTTVCRPNFVIDAMEALESGLLAAPDADGFTSRVDGLLAALAAVRPDPERLRSALAVLADAAAHAPSARRTGLLLLLAWGWWLLGMGSTAARLLAESRALDPACSMLPRVERLTAAPPGWLLATEAEAAA